MKRVMLISIFLLACQSVLADARLNLRAHVGTEAIVSKVSKNIHHLKIGTNGTAPITVELYGKSEGRFPASSKASKTIKVTNIEFLTINFDKFSKIRIIAP